MKPSKSTKLISGAELRRRAADRLAQQNVPNGEAGRRERKLLEHYSAAQEDLQWIVDNNAHVDLGFDTFTEWYKARVQPAVKAAGLRPTPEFALYVLDRVLADDGIKPSVQKHIHRELAEITGLSDHALRRALQDRSERRNDAGADLEKATEAFDAKYSQTAASEPNTLADDGSTLGSSMAPVPSASGPSASPSVDGPDVTPETAAGGLNVAPPVDGAAAGLTEAEQAPASGPSQGGPDVTPTDSSSGNSETDEAPAGTGQDQVAIAEVPAVATNRPGIEPPTAMGEAPAHASVPAAGVPPLPGSGLDNAGGDEVEGEAEHSPSTDHGSDFMGGWREFVRFVLRADTDALGPWLMEAEFTELYGDLELLREQVKKLQRHA